MRGENVFTLLVALTLIFPTDCQDQRNVTAEPGQDVVLPCRAAGNKRLIAVQWSRSDLGSDYVLRYRDERLDEENQNPSFRTRVALLDGAVKDGDVSLVLKNLTASDTGAYECGVAQRGAAEANANMKLISTIYLQVAPPPPPGNPEDSRNTGSRNLHLGLIVSVILVVVLIVAASVLVLTCREPNS
ncbi:CD276 antigen homolog [Xiphophorus hellerii]|uniref:CD276 antigen homolog n=1 Tax=Xiphophorus hellerii TaxID=8084 RepID=UPI0013B3FD73|nr:CD276 antigen homolog [Xiphophorus hellerii]